ncbi:MAG: hypothetical protein IPH31_05640 [Lewinellaceae bacterium]|nr:hypothetical protein [Lewinellaceae bacterium]
MANKTAIFRMWMAKDTHQQVSVTPAASSFQLCSTTSLRSAVCFSKWMLNFEAW